MKVVGYTDRFSAAAGEKIRFMVSCENPTYRADIVRLIHGDPNPAGPGFKEELIETPVNLEYPGREQNFYSGSYVAVPDHPLLRQTGSFTLQSWIYPTTPQKGLQGVLTKWSADDGVGYGLFVDQDGSLGLFIGDQKGQVERVSTGKPLRTGSWYFVAGVYDAAERKVFLYQQPVGIWPKDESRAVVERGVDISTIGESDVPILMAGYWDREASGKAIVQGYFNGKIESPRLFGHALKAEEIKSLRSGAAPALVGDRLIAAWDFARDFSSAKVTDASSHGLYGQTINMPARAMTGHNWTGTEINFNRAPAEYGAIYFHDDDLEDAGWEMDFELAVPEGLRSGVYAARLRTDGGEDYVPFFVRPKRGTSSAPVLLLASTATYMAYANAHDAANSQSKEDWAIAHGRENIFDYPVHPEDKYMVKHQLLSLYDRHSDGSGVGYSSRLRPILNMRPKYYMASLALNRGGGAPHAFSADLYLVDWLEVKGIEYDVVTDEDLHHEGAGLLAPYRVVLTASHPEYWTGPMLDALETYLAEGGRHMYLGGNGYYWVTSFDPQRPHMIEVRRWRGTQMWETAPGEFYHSTTGELGSLWKFRGRSPHKLLGVGYAAEGFDHSLPFHRQPGSFDPRAAFIFEGIGKDELIGDFGLVMGGAGGYEVDRADTTLGTPPHALVLATVTGFTDHYNHCIEEVSLMDSMQGGSKSPLVRGDMVYFETPKDGAVFSVGSITWCGSLSHNNYDNNVSRITENVLRKFVFGEIES